MDVRVAAARRRARVARGPLWLARITLAYAVVAVVGWWVVALVPTASFDLLTGIQASLSAVVAAIPLAVLVARHRPTPAPRAIRVTDHHLGGTRR